MAALAVSATSVGRVETRPDSEAYFFSCEILIFLVVFQKERYIEVHS
jgi:hypothetical protein